GTLQKLDISHQVLNAKQHAREAEIIMHAGRPGTVTIATNMAGRGTDIVLGGNLAAEIEALGDASEEEKARRRADWKKRHDVVLDAGGLHIIGTERHESRRIDNQLRGRSGRQGDVGSSRFYLSLEDDLMRIFASERVSAIMQKLGMERGEAIEHRWVTKAIENAQRKVESRNFDIRKNLLDYDDVANDQRKEVYSLRNELMATQDVSDRIDAIRADVVSEVIDTYIPPQSLDEQWDVAGLEEAIDREFGLRLPIANWLEGEDDLHEEPLRERILEKITDAYKLKENQASPEVMRHFEKAMMLNILDTAWKEHLAAMDHLRQGIHLRGYAQKNPKQEYKREAFELFQGMTERVKTDLVALLSKVMVRGGRDVEAVEEQRRRTAPIQFVHEDAPAAKDASSEQPVAASTAQPVAARHAALASGPGPDAETESESKTPFVRQGRKVGRNEPCPCGSGKKYKQCHGKLA
ncbi:MAG: SEC-C metal-binding domain-containing protein, partial [Gammaproteobacteria bacterium]|nr:SEC-C metal-binding domain-containing protein [Gammaproteobacteria bacterium]